MPDFLLELRSEEIPARMQPRACEDLARLFTEHLAVAGLTAAIETHATPRRLALIARGLPDATQGSTEERRGPRADAPAQALEGFLRSTGLARDQLEERADKKGTFLYAVLARPGRPTADVLAEAIPAIVRAFPWRKSMRWGEASASTESLRWVRPLEGIVALLGEHIVPCEVAGIRSGAATLGHRFHHPGIITIGSADDYEAKLRACHVILRDHERADIIRTGAAELASAAGLALVPDEGLVAENAGLTEWPVPLLGRFDPGFLAVPPEVIRLTMRTNQKYFACTAPDGALAPAFICTANIAAVDGGAAIVAGNERVLSARLADARFFWDADLKIPLDDQAAKLGGIVFHEKLGTVADKVDRVAKLARWLVEEGIVGGSNPAPATTVIPATLADLAERAARLCKADLVTQMVGEFPELQGTIGAHLARAQGEDAAVCDAIRDHYKPVGQGDDVPTAPVTVAVSLADKLDTLMGFFGRTLKPTGSKDPFALRRAMIAVLATFIETDTRVDFQRLLQAASGNYLATYGDLARRELTEFAIDRLKVQQREAGVRHDLIDAVFALGGEDDLVRLLARVHALQAFVDTPEGRDVLAGYKRAVNILKKEGVIPAQAGIQASEANKSGDGSISPTSLDPGLRRDDGPVDDDPLHYLPEPGEAALIAALDAAEPQTRAALETEDFAAAMAALAALRTPLDSFFESVTVNDPDTVKRDSRLTLLSRMRSAMHEVADFSRIEG